MRTAISLCLTLLVLTGFSGDLAAQWEREVGTLVFEDAMLPFPAGPGKVAFYRADAKIPGNPIELIVGDIKTGKEKRVLPGHNFREAASLTAAFSPDGQQLVIPRKHEGGWELFLLEGDSRSGELLTNLAQFREELTPEEVEGFSITPDQQLSVSDLAWSPSGNRLSFSLNRVGKSSVWWHNLKTGESRQATEDRVGYAACFFPDDEHICYAAMAKKGEIKADEDIFKRSLIKGEITTLISSELHEYNPVISPDGKYLLFAQRVGMTNNILAKNLKSGTTVPVTLAGEGQNCSKACWSADGKQIYIQGNGFRAKTCVFVRDFEPFE
jgi:Tol biopolymer transport system component